MHFLSTLKVHEPNSSSIWSLLSTPFLTKDTIRQPVLPSFPPRLPSDQSDPALGPFPIWQPSRTNFVIILILSQPMPEGW